MDTMEVNKVCAAVLAAGIAFFLTGTIGTILVREIPLKEPAIKIEGAAPVEATGAAPKPEELPPLAPLLAKATPADGEIHPEVANRILSDPRLSLGAQANLHPGALRVLKG